MNKDFFFLNIITISLSHLTEFVFLLDMQILVRITGKVNGQYFNSLGP